MDSDNSGYEIALLRKATAGLWLVFYSRFVVDYLNIKTFVAAFNKEMSFPKQKTVEFSNRMET